MLMSTVQAKVCKDIKIHKYKMMILLSWENYFKLRLLVCPKFLQTGDARVKHIFYYNNGKNVMMRIIWNHFTNIIYLIQN